MRLPLPQMQSLHHEALAGHPLLDKSRTLLKQATYSPKLKRHHTLVSLALVCAESLPHSDLTTCLISQTASRAATQAGQATDDGQAAAAREKMFNRIAPIYDQVGSVHVGWITTGPILSRAMRLDNEVEA